jgi:3-polyprenyl-4-hydroxybenzoate decarboxylase
MKLVIAATGASGAIYLQRLLAQIDCAAHEVHLILSGYAKQVIAEHLQFATRAMAAVNAQTVVLRLEDRP